MGTQCVCRVTSDLSVHLRRGSITTKKWRLSCQKETVLGLDENGGQQRKG